MRRTFEQGIPVVRKPKRSAGHNRAMGIPGGGRQGVIPQGSRTSAGLSDISYNSLRSLQDLDRAWRTFSTVGGKFSILAIIRDLARRSHFAQGFFKYAKAQTLGEVAIEPTFMTVADEGDRKLLQKAWAEFASEPTTTGNMNLLQMQKGALQSYLEDGITVFAMLHSSKYKAGMALLPIPREFLDESYDNVRLRIAGGIQFDEDNRVVGYHFHKTYDELWKQHEAWFESRNLVGIPQGSTSTSKLIPVESLAMMTDPSRHDSILDDPPKILAALEALQKIGMLDSATLGAMELAARKNLVITTDQNGDPGDGDVWRQGVPNDEDDKESPTNVDNVTGNVRNGEYYMRPEDLEGGIPDGNTMLLNPGQKASTLDFTWPHAGAVDFRRDFIRQAAAALGVDYSAFANDQSQSNFANTRAATLLSRDILKQYQEIIREQLMRKVFIHWLEIQRVTGRVRLRNAVSWRTALMTRFAKRWWGWIDPSKDAQAQERLMMMGGQTPQGLAAEKGMSFQDVVEDMREAGQMLKEADSKGEITALHQLMPLYMRALSKSNKDKAVDHGEDDEAE